MRVQIDAARLSRLLGGSELAGLRQRLRARYERGSCRDEFTLTDLADCERRALTGLLGRRVLAANSMRVRWSELDDALARAGIAGSLRNALESLDGPLTDRGAERAARKQAWSTTLSRIDEPRLRAGVGGGAGTALLKRLSAGEPARAGVLLTQAARVLHRLPAQGISRAQLAAEVLGDSHALDAGRPVATLVLRARAVDPAETIDATEPVELVEPVEATLTPDPEESLRARWARLGVTVNELALPALCLNLPCAGQGGDGVGASAGEPLHLSLRRLLRRPPPWNVAGRDVFVCENPNVVAIAADRLGAACAPLVCTDGMPAAAQQTLLAQLAGSGARLRYHGDFDWPGLAIANFVMRRFGATAWRFASADYLAASADHEIALAGERRVLARWDARLADTLSTRGIVVHEEGVVEVLLTDLAPASPPRSQPRLFG